ncbi:MAG: iron-sulfur cluster assembly protein [Candidatus Latescibacterota bacterium]
MTALHTKTFEEGSTEACIVEVLKTCYDPEIPVDIYELGLIYDVQINDEDFAEVTMTLTSPACPVAGTLPPEVQQKIKDGVEALSGVSVEIVWDPPWSVDMMSEGAKLELGMM